MATKEKKLRKRLSVKDICLSLPHFYKPIGQSTFEEQSKKLLYHDLCSFRNE
jgi:hypothetical protein